MFGLSISSVLREGYAFRSLKREGFDGESLRGNSGTQESNPIRDPHPDHLLNWIETQGDGRV